MMEVFFDNEKVFSVFKRIISDGDEEVNVFRICYEEGLNPEISAEIIGDFVFLEMIEETDRISEGIFKINFESKILLGLCFFDDIVSKHCRKKFVKELANFGEKSNSFSFEDMDTMTPEEFLRKMEDGL